MARRSEDSRWFVVCGGVIFSPLGKKHQKVSVFTASESALDDRIRIGLYQIYGSDPFAEAGDDNSSSTEQLPMWALGAPLENLDDSTALSCLERHLRRRRNLISTTSLPEISRYSNNGGALQFKDSLLLTYETDPLLKFEDQQDPLSKESFITYLEAWTEIVYIASGVIPDYEDLSSRIIAQRPSAAAAAAAAAGPRNGVPASTPPPGIPAAWAAGPSTRPPFGEQQAAPTVETEDSGQQSTEVISLLSTEVIEADEYYEEEISGPVGGGADDIAFDRSHPRRSNRIFVLESIPKKKAPAPPILEIKKKKKKKRKEPRQLAPTPAARVNATNNNDNEAGPSKFPLDMRQSRAFQTRPMPKKPVPVICGDAEGMWNPQNPLVVSVTKVGHGNGSPEALAAVAELNKKKKRSLVVSANQFEKIGGRATSKSWKYSLRIVPDLKCSDKTIAISQFALEIGIPFEKKLRFKGTGGDGSVPRSLEEVRKCKLTSIKGTLEKAGYSSYMAEKRLNSKRTFQGRHRPGYPGMFDWRLLLPGGVWVRSRDGIIRHPKTADMDENDVIFTDDEEGKGENNRIKCRRGKHCIRVQGHAGQCNRQYDFIKKRRLSKEEKQSTMNKRKKNTQEDAAATEDSHGQNEKYLNYSWEKMVDQQKGARQERWSKRQGLWVTNGEASDNERSDSGEDSSLVVEGSEGGYGGPLGFTSTEEEDYWGEGQEEPILEDCDRL